MTDRSSAVMCSGRVDAEKARLRLIIKQDIERYRDKIQKTGGSHGGKDVYAVLRPFFIDFYLM